MVLQEGARATCPPEANKDIIWMGRFKDFEVLLFLPIHVMALK
jgi:hypothetical protein